MRAGEKCGPAAASRRGPVQKYLGCPRCGRPGAGERGKEPGVKRKRRKNNRGGGGEKRRAGGGKQEREREKSAREDELKLAEREKDAREGPLAKQRVEEGARVWQCARETRVKRPKRRRREEEGRKRHSLRGKRERRRERTRKEDGRWSGTGRRREDEKETEHAGKRGRGHRQSSARQNASLLYERNGRRNPPTEAASDDVVLTTPYARLVPTLAALLARRAGRVYRRADSPTSPSALRSGG